VFDAAIARDARKLHGFLERWAELAQALTF